MKAPEAFRSISEVAAALGVPQHTLRAWETRFPFVKPVKRADGRRYYRPADVAMLGELNRRLSEDKLSTEAIILIHRSGGLVATSASEGGPAPRLRDHLAALIHARNRLVAALG